MSAPRYILIRKGRRQMLVPDTEGYEDWKVVERDVPDIRHTLGVLEDFERVKVGAGRAWKLKDRKKTAREGHDVKWAGMTRGQLMIEVQRLLAERDTRLDALEARLEKLAGGTGGKVGGKDG